MATVGDILIAPEAGWKRYDDTDAILTYIGSWSKSGCSVRYNGGNAVGIAGSAVKFNFTATKFRLISNYDNNRLNDATAVKITIDGTDYYINQYSSIIKDEPYLEFEKTDLSNGEHSVVIKHNGTSGIFTLDAIDIDENGILKPFIPIPTPTQIGNALLRITLNDSSDHDYQLSADEIAAFVKWYNGHASTDTNAYGLGKKIGTQLSTEYMAFEKIISFEVI